MIRKEQLYEGKAKKVYATENPELLIVSYKDDATAFNGLKKGTIHGKGVINNRMSNLLMQRLEKAGIPTHFIRQLSDRETLVKRVSIVPLEVIIRNIAAGSFSKRYGVDEGFVFETPTIEFSYKNDELGDPLLNEYHATAMKLATRINPNPARILRSYANGGYGGSSMELLEPDHSGLIYPKYVDNSRIPREWAEAVLDCDKRCDLCDRCRRTMSDATVTLGKDTSLKV